MADATPMIARCYRHQHPEEFGRESVAAPATGCWSAEPAPPSSLTHLPEEPMGHPGADPWPDVVAYA